MFGWFSWNFNGKMGNEIIEMEKNFNSVEFYKLVNQ